MDAYANNSVNQLSQITVTAQTETTDGDTTTESYTQTFTYDANGNRTINAKVKKTFLLLLNNIEFSGGIGQGFYVEGNALDVIGVSAGMYGNYATVQWSDGKWSHGQDMNIGLSFSLLQVLEVGFNEYTFMQNGQTVTEENWYWINDSKDTWVIASGGFYFIAGGSFAITFDLNNFLKEIREI